MSPGRKRTVKSIRYGRCNSATGSALQCRILSNRYRTLWISDLHLGTGALRAADLLDFLDSITAERIFLVGDIVDLLRIKSRPYFPDSHRRILSWIIEIADNGTVVIYIPGNHDMEFRNLAGREICGIPVMLEAVHTTRTGRSLLVTHGDVLDARIRKGTNLQQFGSSAYRALLALDVMANQLRTTLGREHLSFCSWIKNRLGAAEEYILRFEHIAARYAAERGFDGIVCGHIHRPALRDIHGVLYANDGDWVEHRTALAELDSGELEILRWQTDSIEINALVDKEPIAAELSLLH